MDVKIPLGRACTEPAEHFEPVMGLLLGRAGRGFARSGRPHVRWVATDRDWSSGTGDEVRGPIADLSLTAAGRGARLDQLAGPGVARLTAWLG